MLGGIWFSNQILMVQYLLLNVSSYFGNHHYVGLQFITTIFWTWVYATHLLWQQKFWTLLSLEHKTENIKYNVV